MTASRGINSPTGRDFNLGNMLIISLAIHIAILSGSAFIQTSSTPRITFGPSYSVQLVSSPSSFSGASQTSTLNKEIMKADSRDNAPVLKKSSDAPSKIPIKRLDTPPSKMSQVDQALDRLRKKTAAEPSASSQTGPGQDRQTSANGNSALNDYYRVIWSRIKSQWALPPGILPKGAIEAVVHVRILRNGALTDIGIEKRSGNAYFDDSALRAVKKANPLPALPDWFRESSLDVGIRFHSSEFR
jgi:colicin import membrane protein